MVSKQKTFIIAEAGVNHNGKLSLAKDLINCAKSAGADAVKFQTFKSEELVSLKASKADYQKQTTNSSESQYEMLKKLELTHEMHLDLINHCKNNGILFLSSPFDCDSIDYLSSLDISIMKIPSGEITHVPYLRKIGKLNRQTILSTGMSTLAEIEFAINLLCDAGLNRSNLTLLHCTTEYPCPYKDVNLSAMKTMADKFNLPIGYSDHTPGITIPIAAVAVGATIIEKHITTDKSLPGPDHKASLDPLELKQMVDQIRIVEQCQGSGLKEPVKSEIKNIEIVRKSIFANKVIKKGDIFNDSNLVCKRPGTGISSKNWDMIIGKKSC